jgi:hypothetical protein
MTDPTSPTQLGNNDTSKSVGLLGRLFGKVQRAPEPPAGLEDRLHYEDQVGSNGTDAAYYFPGKVPEMDDGYFPTIADEDAILVHYSRPPADVNPQQWYDDKDVWAKQQRDKIENQTAVPWSDDTSKTGPMADDPKWTPPTVQRPSAFLSPSSYRFTRPFGQDVEHELNGVHLSLADNRRAYNLSGNVGRTATWNNSYRLDPVSNDAQAVFVGDTVTNDVGTAVLYAREQDYNPRPSYRL